MQVSIKPLHVSVMISSLLNFIKFAKICRLVFIFDKVACSAYVIYHTPFDVSMSCNSTYLMFLSKIQIPFQSIAWNEQLVKEQA